MADNDRTFTEGEAYALVNDGVQRETAALTATVAEKDARITELSNTNDILTAEKAAAVTAQQGAVQELADYKTQVETDKAREASRVTRLAEVAAASPALDVTEDTEDGKARIARILAMADDVFAGYLTDLRAVSPQKAAVAKTAAPAPRQSAAFAAAPDGSEAPSVKGLLGARRGLTTVAQSA